MPSTRIKKHSKRRVSRSKSHSSIPLRSTTLCCDPILEEELQWTLHDVKEGMKQSLRDSARDLDRALGTVAHDSPRTSRRSNETSLALAITSSKIKKDQHVTTKQHKKTLPAGVLSDDIYVEVETVQEYNSDVNYLVKAAKEIISSEFQKIYTADKENSFFTLRVLITRVSDGSVSETMFNGKWDLMGTAMLGVAWSLHKNEENLKTKRRHKSSIDKSTKTYNGGLIVLKEELEFFDLIDPLTNAGERFVLETFAPNCVYDIVSEIVRGRHVTSRGRSKEKEAGLVRRMLSMPALRNRQKNLVKGH